MPAVFTGHLLSLSRAVARNPHICRMLRQTGIIRARSSMTKQTPEQTQQALEEWLDSVRHLAAEVRDWAQTRSWSVHQDEKDIRESPFGDYRAPWLRIATPNGEIHLDPVARYVAGPAQGRVDLQAWPSLNRVMLLRRDHDWLIMTDSGVPLRQDWNQQTFLQLADDLLAAYCY